MTRRSPTGRGALVFAAALLAVSATGGTGGTCTEELGGTPQIEPCSAAADCEGRVHATCEGAWACTDGACDWQCVDGNPPACHAAADCEGGAHDACTGQWACASGECRWLCDTDLLPECATPADCDGKAHIECDGEWTCTALHECLWTCIGLPGECLVSGCSGEVCAETSVDTDCLWLDEYACLSLTTCGRLSDGSCGWDPNEAYLACLAGGKECGEAAPCPVGFACVDGQCVAVGCTTNADCAKGEACVNGACVAQQKDCIVSGCSGEVCAEESVFTTCVWLDWYACLRLTTCGRLSDGSCGWDPNEAFLACMAGGKECGEASPCPAGYACLEGRCVAVACTTDADCAQGEACVNGACTAGPACRAVTPGSHGLCKMLIGWIYDGKACVAEGGCGCEPDCDAVFASQDECEAACGIAAACASDGDCPAGQHCAIATCDSAACTGTCAANPEGFCVKDADCAQGDTCVIQACPACANCPCYGTCQGPSACTAVKTGTHGVCAMVLGIVFDGTRCTYESGCSCQPDCDAFFPDLATCQAACSKGA